MNKEMTDISPDEALERFRLIRPFLEDGIPLAELAFRHSVPLRTLQRWVQCYRHYGMIGLTRKGRNDKDTSRRLSTQLLKLIEGLALEKPRISIATIHRMVCDVAKEHGERLPSYSTVYNTVKAIDPALLTLAHEGRKIYNETYDLLYRREAEAPNVLWQADHTLLDIMLLNDRDEPQKPWLSVIVDDYSRAVTGYFTKKQLDDRLPYYQRI